MEVLALERRPAQDERHRRQPALSGDFAAQLPRIARHPRIRSRQLIQPIPLNIR
ncbi:MAG: hypothetical protein KA169_01570 [Burkholderiaceae bacterium]|jgi:hypothetical protein|nr:hypothetical protein [Burkholderiaceae bacterium]